LGEDARGRDADRHQVLPFCIGARGRALSLELATGLGGRRRGEADPDGGALALGRRQVEGPAVVLDDGLDDGEAEADAGVASGPAGGVMVR
jgi:hypothetical protein